jgi:hypothetical protein
MGLLPHNSFKKTYCASYLVGVYDYNRNSHLNAPELEPSIAANYAAIICMHDFIHATSLFHLMPTF